MVALFAFCPLTGFTAYAGESDSGSAPTEPVPEPTSNPGPGLYTIKIFITDFEWSIIDDLGEANGTVTPEAIFSVAQKAFIKNYL